MAALRAPRPPPPPWLRRQSQRQYCLTLAALSALGAQPVAAVGDLSPDQGLPDSSAGLSGTPSWLVRREISSSSSSVSSWTSPSPEMVGRKLPGERKVANGDEGEALLEASLHNGSSSASFSTSGSGSFFRYGVIDTGQILWRVTRVKDKKRDGNKQCIGAQYSGHVVMVTCGDSMKGKWRNVSVTSAKLAASRTTYELKWMENEDYCMEANVSKGIAKNGDRVFLSHCRKHDQRQQFELERYHGQIKWGFSNAKCLQVVEKRGFNRTWSLQLWDCQDSSPQQQFS